MLGYENLSFTQRIFRKVLKRDFYLKIDAGVTSLNYGELSVVSVGHAFSHETSKFKETKKY